MFKALTIIFILCSTSVYADCYERLTRGHGDSALFKVYSGDVYSNSGETLDELMALNAVNKVYRDLDCNEKEAISSMECAEVLRTTLCRIDVSYGYFLITKDYVDTVNVIFNRWD